MMMMSDDMMSSGASTGDMTNKWQNAINAIKADYAQFRATNKSLQAFLISLVAVLGATAVVFIVLYAMKMKRGA